MSAASLSLLLGGCHKAAEPPPSVKLPAIPVAVQKVEAKKHVAVEEVVGTVRAKFRATISPKVSGRIEKLLVAPGEMVKSNQWLVQIDARDIQARLDQAVAIRKQADNDLQRVTELFRQGTVARAEFDRAEMQAHVAEASVKEMETMLGFAKVTAPFDGVITRKIEDVGDLAAPGQGLLEMEDPTALRLEADVPEALIGHIKLGAKMSVRVSTLSNAVEGIVSEMEPVADPNSRTFRVKLDLPIMAGLRSGLFGRVAVPVGETSTLRVPLKAVVVRGQMEMVFVVANNQAHLRLVKTGKQFGDEVELVSGVDAGEVVATDQLNQLVDGQAVSVK
jgi:RND family efflux transporter MFP subunit